MRESVNSMVLEKVADDIRQDEESVPEQEPFGEIIATGVSEEDFMARYAGHFCEWVDGKVIKMSPVREEHNELSQFLIILFKTYFALRPIGVLRTEPYVMRLEINERVRRREPDLQIILNDNPHERTTTSMNGPADIAIEIVSPGSVSVDYGEKFEEYERAGVREYWIFDPIRKQTRFNRLTENGTYALIFPDEEGYYSTLFLPDLKLHVPTLWEEPLPDVLQIVEQIRAMVGQQA